MYLGIELEQLVCFRLHSFILGRANDPASQGRVTGITEDPVRLMSEESLPNGLGWVLARVSEALEKPVLDYETREEISS